MSEGTVVNKPMFAPDKVWGLLMVLTIIYGIILAAIEHGGAFISVIGRGLWTIYSSPAILMHDYIALAGIGPALVNSGMSGLTVFIAFKLAKLPMSGPQMGVFGLVMGFALMGKNPINMIPILFGAFLYSLYKKEPYKNNVTMAGFATCLAPIVSQPAHIPEVINFIGSTGGVVLGAFLGIIIGFVINSMAVFIKKSHEGLNLYNIGWGAGLISIALTMVFSTIGIQRFGPRFSWEAAGAVGAAGAYTPASVPLEGFDYNVRLIILLVGVTVFFFIMGFLSGGKLSNLGEILYMKADDNIFYNKYGQGHTYLAKGFLGLLALLLIAVFQIRLTGGVVGAIISMIGWGGFGKAVANCAAIIAGVMLGGIARYLVHPRFLFAEMPFFYYMSNQYVIWTSAFWGTCLSPMAKYFGWKWALIVGMVHFVFAATIGPFHWGMNLYNNGLAAGFACLVMIPLIRSLDRKGKYPPRVV